MAASIGLAAWSVNKFIPAQFIDICRMNRGYKALQVNTLVTMLITNEIFDKENWKLISRLDALYYDNKSDPTD